MSATFSGLLRTSGNRVGKFTSVNGAGAVFGNSDVSNQTSYDGSNCVRPGFCASASRCESLSLALRASSGAGLGNGSGNPECVMKTPLKVQPPITPSTP